MSANVSTNQCLGCGGPLTGYQTKWCSHRCRKKAYGDPCVDCGARTTHGAERSRVAVPLCSNCYQDRRRMAYRLKDDKFVDLWAAGASTEEISMALGITPKTVRSTAHRLRKQGRDLPRRRPGRKRKEAQNGHE